MIADSSTVTGARRALAIQLAELRRAANYTQTDLASRLGYSRSTVASVEAGHQPASRSFCKQCDRVFDTGGALGVAYDEIEAMIRERHREAAASAQRDRRARIERYGHVAEGRSASSAAATAVIRRALTAVTDPSGGESDDGDCDDGDCDDLESRVLNAYYQQHETHDRGPLSLTLVGGFAGSGKSEFARFLSAVTGWTILDKDALTRALVEGLLLAQGGDVNDRHTPLYQETVRPLEYRCLMDAAVENLRCGIPTVLTAPFVREFADEAWLMRVRNRCGAHRAQLTVVWLKCDVESMHDYIAFRGAARDSWKLSNWSDYLATIDPDFEPRFPHHNVDNRLNATVALADQAREIATRMQS